MTGGLSAIFHALQFAFPTAFRAQYGAAMRADFDDAVSAARAHRGRAAAIGCAIAAYFNVLATAAEEHSSMLMRDLAYALRSLRRAPLVGVVVTATLAVAIGANVAAFGVLRAVVLAPLPYPDGARLAALIGTRKGVPFALSLPDYRDVTRGSSSFDSAAAFVFQTATLTRSGPPQRLAGVLTTPDLFRVLGVKPLLGRGFDAADARAGAARAVAISETLWRSALASDPNAVGRSVVLDGTVYRVVGVMPANLRQPNFDDRDLQDVSFWLPLDPAAGGQLYSRGAHYFTGVARLRAGVSFAAAATDLTTRFARLVTAYPVDDATYSVDVAPAADRIVGNVRPLLVAIFAAVAGVLLVACANAANLLLSRAATREREFAVRAALGASRGRLIAQFLVETLVLAAAGGLLGGALATGALRAIVALRPAGLPRIDDIRFDPVTGAYTLAIVGACTLAAGIAPALALSRGGISHALRAAGRGGDASAGKTARATLTVAEIALTCALVVASGLVLRSYFALTAQPIGFDPAGLSIARMQVPANRERAFFASVATRVRALPGVTNVAWAYSAPFTRRTFDLSFDFVGHKGAGPSPSSQIDVVEANYFDTVGQRLVSGRTFGSADYGSTKFAVVNETFARTFLAGGRGLGTALSVGGNAPTSIVGIVSDARTTYATSPDPMLYMPLGSFKTPNALLVVRAAPGTLRAADVAAAVAASDPLVAAPKLVPFADYLAQDTAQTRIAAGTLGALAIVALALALAGIFAVVSYDVAQRTHEFGVRMALGARARDVIASAVGKAMRTAAIGILCGLVVAAATTRLIAGQLYDVAPLDPATFAAVVVAIAVASFVASLLPALRATRVDPVVALRYE